MWLKHSKYCIELTFLSVTTAPKNGPKKHRKTTPKTRPNRSKIGPRRLPNAASKNGRSKNPYLQPLCRFLLRFGTPPGSQGGGETHISVPRRLQEEPGSQNAPQMLPRPPQDGPKTPPGPFWELFCTIFNSFLGVLGSILGLFSARRQRDRETERKRDRERERERERHRETERELLTP